MIRPLKDRVVVRPPKKEEVTKSGLVVPGGEKTGATDIGDLLEVGDSLEGLTVGDRVLYRKYSGDEVVEGGEKLLILEESEILAVIEE